MSKIIKVRKGTQAELDAILLALGEFGYATDTKTTWIGGTSGNEEVFKGSIKNNKNIKIELVSGVIRQNDVDRTKWDVLTEGDGHNSVGLNGTQMSATTNGILVQFDKTFENVISFVTGVDEHFAEEYQAISGSSVGTSNAQIRMSAHLGGSAKIHYDGANWVITEDGKQDLVVDVAFAGGNLTINTNFCPGQNVVISADTNGGSAIPYVVGVKTNTDNQIVVNFINDARDNFVTVEDTNMSFRISKEFNGAIEVDGSNGYDAIPLENGNIWFVGVFEV